MDLRHATAADATLLSRLHAESWRAAYPGMVPQPYLDSLSDTHWVNAFTAWLSTDEIFAQIASVDGVDAGCVLYGANPGGNLPAVLPDWGEIISLYVLAPFWRQGGGQALLTAAMQALHQQNRPGCYLWALRENTRARAFYAAQGFQLTDKTIIVPLAGTELTDLCYQYAF